MGDFGRRAVEDHYKMASMTRQLKAALKENAKLRAVLDDAQKGGTR
jgi:hypothetical protein